MKKYILPFCLMFLAFTLTAQTLSEEELKSVAGQMDSITFENYVGPVTIFNTGDEIRGIGLHLAETDGAEVSWGNKYKIIRSFQADIPNGLDADIFIILPDAGVDHIDNLRRILSAYIAGTFDYNNADADVLAEFVTYYNAVYYKNINHFKEKYKEGVLTHLNAQDAGLSTHYSEWAGKSKVVIPLKSGNGLISSSLDTSTISSEEVIEEMQQEEDRALDSRREMVEIREDELDERQEALDTEQKALDDRQETLEEREKSVREELEEKKDELSQVEDGSPEEAALEEEIQELEKEKAVIQEEQKELEEDKQALEEEQDSIDQEQDEVVRMREEIAQDENELNQNEGLIISSTREEEPEGFWFVKVDRSADPAPFGTLLKVTKEGEVLKTSALNSIRGTSLAEGAEGIIVIAGKNEERSRVKALILDPETLEVLKEGNDEIYPASGIWTKAGNLFMISRNDQDWSVAKYSLNLELQKMSSLTVHPDTGLVFLEDRILVQNDKDGISALDLNSLNELKED